MIQHDILQKASEVRLNTSTLARLESRISKQSEELQEMLTDYLSSEDFILDSKYENFVFKNSLLDCICEANPNLMLYVGHQDENDKTTLHISIEFGNYTIVDYDSQALEEIKSKFNEPQVIPDSNTQLETFTTDITQ